MKAWQRYFQTMNEVVEKAYNTQGENIMKAAALLTECTKNDGIIHMFGCGHSGLVTEDVFWRSATLANVHAIFESAVSGINEITKTSRLEKVEGLGRVIAEYNRLAPPDVLVCFFQLRQQCRYGGYGTGRARDGPAGDSFYQCGVRRPADNSAFQRKKN